MNTPAALAQQQISTPIITEACEEASSCISCRARKRRRKR